MNLLIKVNNEEVELTDFSTRIIMKVLIGILESLHGVDEINSAEFKLTAK